MKHILITRFAMRWPANSPRRAWEHTPEWLDYRMELFEKYTVPSVQAQTFKDFRWVILVDPNFKYLKDRHIKRLLQYGDVVPVNFYFQDSSVDMGAVLDYNDAWVCSTRLDSDDIICNDFMERVHEQATEEEAWITFVKGYMLKGGMIAPREFVGNPFVSYVEYADPFKGVFSISHMEIEKQSSLCKKIDVPGWIQVDHADNIKNLVKRKMRDFDEKALDASLVYDNFTWERHG